MTPHTLVLWDIDLTLVDLRGTGADWYGTVLRRLAGQAIRHVPSMQGRTERAITTELLNRHGIPDTEDEVRRVFAALVDVVAEDREVLHERGSALPGAAAVLRALADTPGVVQSLVTGNLPEVARFKLDAFGLDEHVDFEVGGYGHESVERHPLVSTAVTLAGRKYGVAFPAERVVVVGDTPHDVAAALHHGATAVGVATGRCDAAELRAAGAHVVLPDLVDTAGVLAALVR
ncbi:MULTISPECIES: haloacid dehalogenase-like hydrolase [unclassified Crossiella]|uniref:HAD family hydrolase n=1 Tax=unclassified Crossiella TaxID=2620835 RepID=UPI001FFF01FA|nr:MULTISPECIES: haloacid dehalogenase-like hydrolase [unclassified Crossiella]MCK2242572.1 haloacid dehalogenase-like hydrolase [Crossiella sp. S99.2]MCK2254398.1 haloacid dehalogenase-like hydrolase [Crossiella sp. S99.1]